MEFLRFVMKLPSYKGYVIASLCVIVITAFWSQEVSVALGCIIAHDAFVDNVMLSPIMVSRGTRWPMCGAFL
jgi:hypothetical protein